MRKIMFCLLIAITSFLTAEIDAKEVYCSVVSNASGSVEIKPNKDYLNDMYWRYILYEKDGNKRGFKDMDEAITLLGTFGWHIVKYEMLGKQITCIMGLEVESYFELKSSRNLMNEILTDVTKENKSSL